MSHVREEEKKRRIWLFGFLWSVVWIFIDTIVLFFCASQLGFRSWMYYHLIFLLLGVCGAIYYFMRLFKPPILKGLIRFFEESEEQFEEIKQQKSMEELKKIRGYQAGLAISIIFIIIMGLLGIFLIFGYMVKM